MNLNSAYVTPSRNGPMSGGKGANNSQYKSPPLSQSIQMHPGDGPAREVIRYNVDGTLDPAMKSGVSRISRASNRMRVSDVHMKDEMSILAKISLESFMPTVSRVSDGKTIEEVIAEDSVMTTDSLVVMLQFLEQMLDRKAEQFRVIDEVQRMRNTMLKLGQSTMQSAEFYKTRLLYVHVCTEEDKFTHEIQQDITKLHNIMLESQRVVPDLISYRNTLGKIVANSDTYINQIASDVSDWRESNQYDFYSDVLGVLESIESSKKELNATHKKYLDCTKGRILGREIVALGEEMKRELAKAKERERKLLSQMFLLYFEFEQEMDTIIMQYDMKIRELNDFYSSISRSAATVTRLINIRDKILTESVRTLTENQTKLNSIIVLPHQSGIFAPYYGTYTPPQPGKPGYDALSPPELPQPNSSPRGSPRGPAVVSADVERGLKQIEQTNGQIAQRLRLVKSELQVMLEGGDGDCGFFSSLSLRLLQANERALKVGESAHILTSALIKVFPFFANSDIMLMKLERSVRNLDSELRQLEKQSKDINADLAFNYENARKTYGVLVEIAFDAAQVESQVNRYAQATEFKKVYGSVLTTIGDRVIEVRKLIEERQDQLVRLIKLQEGSKLVEDVMRQFKKNQQEVFNKLRKDFEFVSSGSTITELETMSDRLLKQCEVYHQFYLQFDQEYKEMLVPGTPFAITHKTCGEELKWLQNASMNTEARKRAAYYRDRKQSLMQIAKGQTNMSSDNFKQALTALQKEGKACLEFKVQELDAKIVPLFRQLFIDTMPADLEALERFSVLFAATESERARYKNEATYVRDKIDKISDSFRDIRDNLLKILDDLYGDDARLLKFEEVFQFEAFFLISDKSSLEKIAQDVLDFNKAYQDVSNQVMTASQENNPSLTKLQKSIMVSLGLKRRVQNISRDREVINNIALRIGALLPNMPNSVRSCYLAAFKILELLFFFFGSFREGNQTDKGRYDEKLSVIFDELMPKQLYQVLRWKNFDEEAELPRTTTPTSFDYVIAITKLAEKRVANQQFKFEPEESEYFKSHLTLFEEEYKRYATLSTQYIEALRAVVRNFNTCMRDKKRIDMSICAELKQLLFTLKVDSKIFVDLMEEVLTTIETHLK